MFYHFRMAPKSFKVFNELEFTKLHNKTRNFVKFSWIFTFLWLEFSKIDTFTLENASLCLALSKWKSEKCHHPRDSILVEVHYSNAWHMSSLIFKIYCLSPVSAWNVNFFQNKFLHINWLILAVFDHLLLV